MSEPKRPPVDPKPVDQKKLNRFGLALGAVALFMFVSFIVKTAMNGP